VAVAGWVLALECVSSGDVGNKEALLLAVFEIALGLVDEVDEVLEY